MELNDFLGHTCQAILSQEKDLVATFFMFEGKYTPKVDKSPSNVFVSNIISKLLSNSIPTEEIKHWSTVVFHHLNCMHYVQEKGLGKSNSLSIIDANLEMIFESEHSSLIEYLQIVASAQTNWVVPLLHVLVSNTVRILSGIEKKSIEMNRKDIYINLVNTFTTTLRNSFSYTINHRISKDQMHLSKKFGALYLVNVLFKLYFQLDQLRQCKFLINAVENPSFPPFSEFPRKQQIIYKYYTGRLAMYDDNFTRANTQLTFCLSNCHSKYIKNRYLILQALIPVRLLQGVLPKKSLLSRHKMVQYESIIEAMQTGNLALFKNSLLENRVFFIRSGTFLLLDRLYLHVYTMFLRKVSKYSNKVQLSIPFIQTLLDKTCNISQSTEEIICILTNLISMKFLRGYVNHNPPVLVLAKQNAFQFRLDL
jgi:nuclear mRNA export protein PCID2/THP1